MIAFMAFPFSLEFFLTLYPFKWHALLTCRVKKSVSSVASGSCTVCATRNAADHSSSSSDGIANRICEARQSRQFRHVMSNGRVAEQAAAHCASPTVSETCFAALFLLITRVSYGDSTDLTHHAQPAIIIRLMPRPAQAASAPHREPAH